MRTCESCHTAAAGGRYARYCKPCAASFRRPLKKYQLTPQIIEYLRTFYKGSPRERGKAVRILAREKNLPKWWILRHAQKLGLGYPMRRKSWTQDEVLFLQENIGLWCPEILAKKMGRSITSVVLKIKRLHLSRRKRDGWFTLRDLEIGLGADHRQIYSWIRKGWIHCERDGRIAGTSGEHFRRFGLLAVRNFIWNHPTEFDLKKADQLWFLNLMRMCSDKKVLSAD